MTALIPLTNTPRDYAWGTIDGVAHALGWPGTARPEAELWLGAHVLSPSRRADAAGPTASSHTARSGACAPAPDMVGLEAGAPARSETGAEAGAPARSEVGAEAGAETHAEAGAEARSETGAPARAETDAEAGAPARSDTGAETGAEAGADAESTAGSDADGAEAGTAWRDLAEWEQKTGTALPYLLKLLAAASPLSLQAHPTSAQAREGFAREQAAGVPLSARERNYKDPHAKPELIVAVDDGFEALCGFRPVGEGLGLIDRLIAASDDGDALREWREHARVGVREAFAWLLSGAAEVDAAVAAATATAQAHPRRFELIDRLSRGYPGDPGILVAQMLNHVTLGAGEALWLPAGNIHAYLRGTGVELMGPSDNVLRGGLTPKHVDRDELQKVLDFTPGPPSRLHPTAVGTNAVSYRPASVASGEGVGFELLLITGDATVRTGSAAIALAVEGSFTVAVDGMDAAAARGGILFIDAPDEVRVTGAGRLFVATGA